MLAHVTRSLSEQRLLVLTNRHGDDLVLRAWGAAPVSQQQQVFGGELDRAGARRPVGEDVLVEYFVKASNGDAQGGSGFRFGVQIFGQSAQSGHRRAHPELLQPL